MVRQKPAGHTDEPGWPTEIGAVLQLIKPNEGLTGCAGASWRLDNDK